MIDNIKTRSDEFMNPTGEAQGGAALGFLQTQGRVDQAHRRVHFLHLLHCDSDPTVRKKGCFISGWKNLCRKFKGMMNCLGASLVFLFFCSKF